MLFLEILYLINTAWLAIYGVHTLFNAFVYLWKPRSSSFDTGFTSDGPRTRMKVAGDCEPETDRTPLRSPVPRHPSLFNAGAADLDDDLPIVTVQLPIYNERHVVNRLIEAVTRLDWPRDRLHIQVLDDSTDDTTRIIAHAAARAREQGAWIEHVRRPSRRGYKAGALAYGMARTPGRFLAIFDADFLPPPDFLRQTMPSFADPAVGCVQTRWGHVNPDFSALTRSQALGIDGHFFVEQEARHRLGAFLNFNGTAGVWRRDCIEDAGGWQADTLTEDLDLSYRAQLRGWRIHFLSHVESPAELPVQVDAFKRQQFRWAKGSIQTARKLMRELWRSPHPWWRKVLGSLHLTGYLVHPLMLMNLLLLLPLTHSRSPLLLITPFFSLAAVGPPLMYWLAMAARGRSPLRTRAARLGGLVALGTGLAVNNTRAVLEAFLGTESAFKRTPKFAVARASDEWRTSNYALPRDPTVWMELLLAIYASGLLVYVMTVGLWTLWLWVLMYAAGFSYLAYLGFVQGFQLRAARLSMKRPTPAVQPE